MVRDDHTCAYCGRSARPGGGLASGDLTVDHVLPRSRGGQSTWTNTVACCRKCNFLKGDRLPHEAGMKLRIEPKIPRTNYLLLAGNVPSAWKVWIET
jgi:5-methylcytosine-specific restriction endonuclease McrA